jgi:hypothetical protein
MAKHISLVNTSTIAKVLLSSVGRAFSRITPEPARRSAMMG